MGETVVDGASVVGLDVGWKVGNDEGANVGDAVGSLVSPM